MDGADPFNDDTAATRHWSTAHSSGDSMNRRNFLKYVAAAPLAATGRHGGSAMPAPNTCPSGRSTDITTLFVAGDVMTGRGIDQILPHPGNPRIAEHYSRSALDYVVLAEETNGPISRPVDFDYIWGDALAVLTAAAPDARIVNLETAVTRQGSPWPRKGIQYRMHPENVPCLIAAGIDCCTLANNHILDWNYAGLRETLATLAAAGLATAGAGPDRAMARSPATLCIPGGGRVLVFAAGLGSSGIPPGWAATADRPGINLLADLSGESVAEIATAVGDLRQPGDVVVISLHWGGNWGYTIPAEHSRFARALIDAADVDLVHGHSSHHPLGIEVYRGKPILYGCGDLIDDYEGISGHAEYRVDLALLYLVTIDRMQGQLLRLEMIPMRRRNFRLNRVDNADRDWLQERLDRECRLLGTRISLTENNTLQLHWG
jgi:poly-gamma-glutamate capsule biosynthesis protein CapA/YwtB (metallophosphatase superfamily)